MPHFPLCGVLCIMGLSFVVSISASPRLNPNDECRPYHVTCKCGRQRPKVTVSVPVKRCLKFDGYSSYCDACQPSVGKRILCKKFRHCTSCDSDGCVTCRDNRYGATCRKDCSSLCQNGGTCRNNSCICPEGFTGNKCQDIKDKDCMVVTKPANGYVTTTERIATYACAKGYHLIGQQILKCEPDGTWSSDAPVCEAICTTPNATEHLYFSRQELYEVDEYEGAVMKLAARCDEGYRIVGSRAVYCNLNGTWSSLPHCAERGKCTEPHVIDNGSSESFSDEKGYFEGTEVTYKCDFGFVLKGSFSLICKENGEWSHNPPRCEAELPSLVICPNLTIPNNGTIDLGQESNPRRFVSGVRVVYSCDKGFILHPNHPDRYCQRDGTWLPSLPPRCLPVITCPDPGYPNNGKRCFGYDCSKSSNHATFTTTCGSRAEIDGVTVTLPENNYVNGTYVEFKCNPPYYAPSGFAFTRCSSDGTWTNPTPKCFPVCGQIRTAYGLIYRGEEVPPEDLPWHVILTERGNLRCGGVLLGDSWVLTAAHCVTKPDTTGQKNITHLSAQFGKQKFYDSPHSSEVQIRRISEVHVHINYNPATFSSDIALLKLSKSVTISSRVKPVCLSQTLPANSCSRNTDPNASEKLESCDYGDNVNEHIPNRSDKFESFISGFGCVSRDTSGHSNTLRKARVVIESNKTRCMENLQKHDTYTNVDDNMFCAGGGKYSHPCSGDSGGPLVTSLKDRYYLQGIVSWGAKDACETSDSYGVFTNVTKFYGWIQDTSTPDLIYYK